MHPHNGDLRGEDALAVAIHHFIFFYFSPQKELFKCLLSKLSKVMGKKKRAIQNWSLKTKVLKGKPKVCVSSFHARLERVS
jgi:hypothetical protein